MGHNIEAVIGDIEDTKKDLDRNLNRSLSTRMKALMQTAITHVKEDADWRGTLVSSLRAHGVKVKEEGHGEFSISVGTDKNVAEYAPFVEFGTGKRTGRRGPGAVLPQPPHQYPSDYPYDSPPMTAGLVQGVIEWVETKPIQPNNGTDTEKQLGQRIAATIAQRGTYAHPYLRPAWYKNKRHLKNASRSAVRSTFR